MSNSVQRFGKAPEKPNFSQKCNLLSRYLKERGSFGDISLGMTGKIEPKGQELSNNLPTTMTTNSLLPNMENSIDDSKQNAVASSPNIKSGDFFQHLSSASASIKDTTAAATTTTTTTTTNSADLRKNWMVGVEAGPAQLTIFYAGQVLVYNDFPADKVKEITELAKQGICSANNASVATDGVSNPATSANPVVPDLNVPSTSGNENTQLHHIERIARRASLHRFFAKRKDRVAAKAPYHLNHQHGGLPPKPEEANFFPEEGQSSRGVNFEALQEQQQQQQQQQLQLLKPEDPETNPSMDEGQCSKHLDLRL